MINMTQLVDESKVIHKSIEQRSRGKFKPEIRKLTNNQIKSVLLEKIAEEEVLINEDPEDKLLLSDIALKRNKFNVVSLFSGAGGLDLGLELAGLSSVIGESKAMESFFSSKQRYDKVR
ncbi:TPA: DNA cytosine methyltransferase, partial [Enterococcus faecalis]|nr:DNA cytosine methyltransferase [Enterococcus faecalis]